MNKKIIIITSVVLLVVISVVAGYIYSNKDKTKNPPGENNNAATTRKEPSQAYKETEPTPESKAAVREAEKKLKEEKAAEYTKFLDENKGISEETNLFDVSAMSSVLGKEAMDKYIPSSSWELENPNEVRTVEVKEDTKNKVFDAELTLRVKNMVTDYSVSDTQNGNIVIYKVDKNGNKSDFIDFSKAKERLEANDKYAKWLINEIPEELVENSKLKQAVELNFNKKGTDIYLSIYSEDKEELKKALVDVVRIGVEVREGLSWFHSEKDKFDYSVPVLIK